MRVDLESGGGLRLSPRQYRRVAACLPCNVSEVKSQVDGLAGGRVVVMSLPFSTDITKLTMNTQVASLWGSKLSSAYNSLRGDIGAPQTATDTIDKLVEKIQTSAAVEDRRTAVLGLKGLSRDWKEASSERPSGVDWRIVADKVTGCRQSSHVLLGCGTPA